MAVALLLPHATQHTPRWYSESSAAGHAEGFLTALGVDWEKWGVSEETSTSELQRAFRDAAPRLWRALRLMGVAEADIEDLCQETFIIALRRIGTFEGRSTIQTWLYGISVRVAADHRRKAHVRREVLSDEPEKGMVNAAQVDELQRAEIRAKLYAALDELDEAKRQVFVLYEVEGLEMKEVAAAVGCPIQTAYSRLHAARRSVMAHFERSSESVPALREGA